MKGAEHFEGFVVMGLAIATSLGCALLPEADAEISLEEAKLRHPLGRGIGESQELKGLERFFELLVFDVDPGNLVEGFVKEVGAVGDSQIFVDRGREFAGLVVEAGEGQVRELGHSSLGAGLGGLSDERPIRIDSLAELALGDEGDSRKILSLKIVVAAFGDPRK